MAVRNPAQGCHPSGDGAAGVTAKGCGATAAWSAEPDVSRTLHEAGQERSEADQPSAFPVWAGLDQPPITRAIRSLRASALKGFTM
jgi:hypothetical protein